LWGDPVADPVQARSPPASAHLAVRPHPSRDDDKQRGELSAAIELRRLFPGITDNAQALECARTTRRLDAVAAGEAAA
jgi:hypothetical protein